MARKLFRGTKPQCLSASVTEPSQAALVMRFKAMANQRRLSVQKLLLEAVEAFLDSKRYKNEI